MKRGLIFKPVYKQVRVEDLYDTVMGSIGLRNSFRFYVRNNETTFADMHIFELGYGDISFSDFMDYVKVL